MGKYMNRCVHVCSGTQSSTLCNPWTGGPQASLSMGFPRQEYWSGLSFLPPGVLPKPGIEPTSLTSPSWQVASLFLVPPGKSLSSLIT